MIGNSEIKKFYMVGIEATMRKNGKREYLFLLNHTKEPFSVRMEKAGTDILTDEKYREGDLLTIKEAGAATVQRERFVTD